MVSHYVNRPKYHLWSGTIHSIVPLMHGKSTTKVGVKNTAWFLQKYFLKGKNNGMKSCAEFFKIIHLCTYCLAWKVGSQTHQIWADQRVCLSNRYSPILPCGSEEIKRLRLPAWSPRVLIKSWLSVKKLLSRKSHS